MQDVKDRATDGLSSTNALGADLQAALGGPRASSANGASSKTFPVFLNPCLALDGAGTIGLPLSARDAGAIIEIANTSQRGLSEAIDTTLANVQHQGSWEIRSSKLAFGNGLWHGFLDKTVRSMLEESEIAFSSDLLECEISNMRLHGPGLKLEPSIHLAGSNVYERQSGTIGFVVVILPSEYTAGELRVSHPGASKVFDCSAISMLEMSVVLCYGDCTLETGPVISGYRLCLVYNLNHAESGLERVLTRWRSTGSPNLFAYILEHQYSPERFSHGLNILEGQDVHKMAALNLYAEQLGFMLCLGNLVCRAPGDLASYDSNEDIESHGQKREVRWTSYGLSTEQDCGGSSINSTFDDGDEPDIDQRFFYILNLVDQEGKTLRNSKERLKLKAPQIVPLSAFEDVDPDETVYKSFQVEGCDMGSFEKYWRRSALVILPKDEVQTVLRLASEESEGINEDIAAAASDQPEAGTSVDKSFSGDQDALDEAHKESLVTQDLPMWKRTVKSYLNSSSSYDVSWKLLPNAAAVFGFIALREVYDRVLAKGRIPLDSRIAFIGRVVSNTPKSSLIDAKTALTWKWEKLDAMLETLENPSTKDIHAVIRLVRHYGHKKAVQKVIPELARNASSTYTFWIPFIEALLAKKETLHSSGDEEDSTTVGFDQVLDACIDIVTPLWEDVEENPDSEIQCLRVSRILEILDICLRTKRMYRCKLLLASVLKSPGEISSKYSTIYSPLLSRLPTLLSKHAMDLVTSPFKELMQVFIGQYLHDVLGAKPTISTYSMRQVGCGCADCLELDRFLMGPDVEEVFLMSVQRKSHIESRVMNIQHLVSYEMVTVGHLRGIQIIKRTDAAVVDEWKSRVVAARGFLKQIGDNDFLAKVLGRRYPDIERALNGVQKFLLPLNGPRYPHEEKASFAGEKRKATDDIDRPFPEKKFQRDSDDS